MCSSVAQCFGKPFSTFADIDIFLYAKGHFVFCIYSSEWPNNSPVAPVKRVLINSLLLVRFVSHAAHEYNLVPLIWSKKSRPIFLFWPFFTIFYTFDSINSLVLISSRFNCGVGIVFMEKKVYSILVSSVLCSLTAPYNVRECRSYPSAVHLLLFSICFECFRDTDWSEVGLHACKIEFYSLAANTAGSICRAVWIERRQFIWKKGKKNPANSISERNA